MIRQADVYYRDRLAGRLEELFGEVSSELADPAASMPGVMGDGSGDVGPIYYRFTYDPKYLESGEPISLTLPLQAESFESKTIPSFFAGLVPEGWYLSIASAVIKVDAHDTFGLLMRTCGDCIGAVSLREVGEVDD